MEQIFSCCSNSIRTNFGGSHWFTVEGVTPSLAQVYDSMCYTTSTTTQLQIAALMCCQASSITVNVQSMCLQNGGSDCGVYAIAYATDLCHGNHPEGLQYHQDRLRSHLIECLESKKMLPFPSQRRHAGKPQTENISVYCSCRLPETDGEKMAACDRCNEWYHLSCDKSQQMSSRTPKFHGHAVNVIRLAYACYAHACRLNVIQVTSFLFFNL